MTRRAAILALAAIATVFPVGAAQITETTTYFNIRGSTLEELDAQMQRQGPVVGTGGLRHPGATRVQFDGYVTFRRHDGRCRVDETELGLDLEMTLPRWKSGRGASPETALIWRTISEDIARHEREHADIARHWLRRMEGALRNLKPQRDCRRMEESVNATTRRYLRMHERAQRDFDIVEGREVNVRLRRALRANIRAYEAQAAADEGSAAPVEKP